MQVLGIKSESSGKAASGFNHRTVCPAPEDLTSMVVVWLLAFACLPVCAFFQAFI